MPALDPIFTEFAPYNGPSRPGSTIVDFLGTSVRWDFIAPQYATVDAPFLSTGYPPANEDLIAWIDLLRAVVAAKNGFTMVELGAGYGVWSVRAAKAHQLISADPCRIVAVEAEPTHYEWLNLSFRDNGLDPAAHRLINVAISDKSGSAMFYVSAQSGEHAPRSWYGQRLMSDDEARGAAKVVEYENGTKAVEVPVMTLGDVLKELDTVDFIHIDIQGHELRVVSSGIEALDNKAKRVHIGTHSEAVEEGLRGTLSEHGWECGADYPGKGRRQTPYGEIVFEDGVQSWTNPRLS
jgi:FkbM family methyltransferase